MEMEEWNKNQYIKYLKLLIKLQNLHQSLFGPDKYLITPACFSEKICRHLLSLNEIDGKEYDAKDDAGKTYEIKATSDPHGNTTISDEKPDFLVWIFFDYANKKLVIKKINYEAIKDKLSKTSEDSSGRRNISLSRIFISGEHFETSCFCMITLKKIADYDSCNDDDDDDDDDFHSPIIV